MLKLFEMFAGYGGASFALQKAGIKFECVGYSEIDKFAIQCYEQNHKGKNYGDCTKINPNDLQDFDLLTGGFPCQSFSAAGKGLGKLDTRGTLVYDIIRIAEVKKPKYMLLENVKGFTFKKFKDTFNKVLNELDRIGYDVHWKVLNTKDYGVPQNRERVFFVCIRKDLKQDFKFPIIKELKLTIKDILEEVVDNKYYLNEEQITRLFSKDRTLNERFIDKDYSSTLMARDYKDPKVICINPFNGKNSTTESGTIGTSVGSTTGKTAQLLIKEQTIRKITPKECFRLMGFLNDEINLSGLSNTQRYKLAGNGWDINLVSLIFKQMFKQKKLLEE
jgi:DNA (cytosine-5)-methyltransferase 1